MSTRISGSVDYSLSMVNTSTSGEEEACRGMVVPTSSNTGHPSARARYSLSFNPSHHTPSSRTIDEALEVAATISAIENQSEGDGTTVPYKEWSEGLLQK